MRPALCQGRHLEAEILVLCVHWYLRFSFVTIRRWVQWYAPELYCRCHPELREDEWRVALAWIFIESDHSWHPALRKQCFAAITSRLS